MPTKLTEEEIKQLAAQLRKPEGKQGIEIGETMNSGNGPMNLHTIAVLDPQSNESILEIGMGNGHFVKNIVNVDPTIKYTGADYSELMVKEAFEKNKHLIDKGRNVTFVNANIQHLPFEDNSFDKLFTVNTFYFWEDKKAALKELKRVLKKDGKLILSVRPKHVMEKIPMTKYGFSLFTKEEMIALLTNAGFDSIEVTEIKEPPQMRWGKPLNRECLILCCHT